MIRWLEAAEKWRHRYTTPVTLLSMLEALDDAPPYRFRVELALIRRLAAGSANLDFEALCIDLDRASSRSRSLLRRFVRAWLLILHGDAALRRDDSASGRRYLEAAAIECGEELSAVARLAIARLA